MGAIFHAMLPIMPEKEKMKTLRNHYCTYVDSSIHHIVYSFHRRGIPQKHIDAKVFGGAQAIFIDKLSPSTKNIMTAYEVLTEYNIQVVASDVGGHKELITDNETGFLFKAGDSVEFGERVIDLLADKNKLKSVLLSGRTYVENFRNWKKSVSSYLPLYKKIIEKNSL